MPAFSLEKSEMSHVKDKQTVVPGTINEKAGKHSLYTLISNGTWANEQYIEIAGYVPGSAGGNSRDLHASLAYILPLLVTTQQPCWNRFYGREPERGMSMIQNAA